MESHRRGRGGGMDGEEGADIYVEYLKPQSPPNAGGAVVSPRSQMKNPASCKLSAQTHWLLMFDM